VLGHFGCCAIMVHTVYYKGLERESIIPLLHKHTLFCVLLYTALFFKLRNKVKTKYTLKQPIRLDVANWSMGCYLFLLNCCLWCDQFEETISMRFSYMDLEGCVSRDQFAEYFALFQHFFDQSWNLVNPPFLVILCHFRPGLHFVS
jgi:hypothetical protein